MLDDTELSHLNMYEKHIMQRYTDIIIGDKDNAQYRVRRTCITKDAKNFKLLAILLQGQMEFTLEEIEDFSEYNVLKLKPK